MPGLKPCRLLGLTLGLDLGESFLLLLALAFLRRLLAFALFHLGALLGRLTLTLRRLALHFPAGLLPLVPGLIQALGLGLQGSGIDDSRLHHLGPGDLLRPPIQPVHTRQGENSQDQVQQDGRDEGAWIAARRLPHIKALGAPAAP
ncbi:MAG: hypothetical protein IPN92_13415 [Chromatiaceae bacterium]|nr:hypothetical protein [Chromatiaceae bacterium]